MLDMAAIFVEIETVGAAGVHGCGGGTGYSHVWRHSEMVVASRRRRLQIGHVMQLASRSRLTITTPLPSGAGRRRGRPRPRFTGFSGSASTIFTASSFACSPSASSTACASATAAAASGLSTGGAGDADPLCMAWVLPRTASSTCCGGAKLGASHPPPLP
jgi:hypothetical protein